MKYFQISEEDFKVLVSQVVELPLKYSYGIFEILKSIEANDSKQTKEDV